MFVRIGKYVGSRVNERNKPREDKEKARKFQGRECKKIRFACFREIIFGGNGQKSAECRRRRRRRASFPFIMPQNNKNFVCLVPWVLTFLFMTTVSRPLYASCQQICTARSPSCRVFSSSDLLAQPCGRATIMETKLRILRSTRPFSSFSFSAQQRQRRELRNHSGRFPRQITVKYRLF